jgi:hypothetical protein
MPATAEGRAPSSSSTSSKIAAERNPPKAQDLWGDCRNCLGVFLTRIIHLAVGWSEAISAIVGAVKAVTAHRLGGPVWQGGFRDHAVRHEEYLAALARYIVANPLRAGLVEPIGDYPHWDAAWL